MSLAALIATLDGDDRDEAEEAQYALANAEAVALPPSTVATIEWIDRSDVMPG